MRGARDRGSQTLGVAEGRGSERSSDEQATAVGATEPESRELTRWGMDFLMEAIFVRFACGWRVTEVLSAGKKDDEFLTEDLAVEKQGETGFGGIAIESAGI